METEQQYCQPQNDDLSESEIVLYSEILTIRLNSALNSIAEFTKAKEISKQQGKRQISFRLGDQDFNLFEAHLAEENVVNIEVNSREQNGTERSTLVAISRKDISFESNSFDEGGWNSFAMFEMNTKSAIEHIEKFIGQLEVRNN